MSEIILIKEDIETELGNLQKKYLNGNFLGFELTLIKFDEFIADVDAVLLWVVLEGFQVSPREVIHGMILPCLLSENLFESNSVADFLQLKLAFDCLDFSVKIR